MNIKNFCEKVFTAFHNQNIKFKILCLYLTIIVLSIGVVSYIIYISTEKQLTQNIYYITNEAVNQINNNIFDKFSIITEQLVKIKFDDELEHLTNIDVSNLSAEEKTEAGIHFKKIFDEIYSFANNYELIHSMVIYLDNGMGFLFEQGKYSFQMKKLSQREIEQYCFANKNYCWLNVHSDPVFFKGSGAKMVSIAAPLRKGKEFKACVIVNMNESYLKKLIENNKLANTGSMIIVSEDGRLTSQNYPKSAELDAVIAKQVLHNRRESDRFEYQSRRYDFLVVYNTIRVNGWKLALILKRRDLMQDINRAKYSVIFFTLVILFVTAGVAVIIAYGLTKPINKLSELMATVESGNLDIRFNTRYHDEIGRLTTQFNSMLEKIQVLIREVEQEQAQKKAIELETLQMQIDPHFLYNTLDSIKFLAEQKSDATSEMVRALGQFYRGSLRKGDGIVSVAEEAEHLRNYLIIQKVRYATQFDYRIEIDDAVLHYETVKFILQPLVENSIYHGVRKKRQKGMIIVRGYQEAGALLFTIFDNGAGMSPDRLENVREKLTRRNLPKDSGIGLYNVHKRIVMRYGEQYGLEIESVKNEFTVIKVKLPYCKSTEAPENNGDLKPGA